MRISYYILPVIFIASLQLQGQQLIYSESSPKDSYLSVNAEFGYANWQTTISNGTQEILVDYIHGLKDGETFRAGTQYFFNRFFGVGPMFSSFQSHNRKNNIGLVNMNTDSIIAIGYLEDNVSILFYGLSLSSGLDIKPGSSFLQFSLSPGLISYTQKSHYVVDDYLINGKKFGLDAAASLEFRFAEYYGIGIRGSILFGSIKKLDVDGNEYIPDPPESMVRVNITVGFRVYLH